MHKAFKKIASRTMSSSRGDSSEDAEDWAEVTHRPRPRPVVPQPGTQTGTSPTSTHQLGIRGWGAGGCASGGWQLQLQLQQWGGGHGPWAEEVPGVTHRSFKSRETPRGQMPGARGVREEEEKETFWAWVPQVPECYTSRRRSTQKGVKCTCLTRLRNKRELY